MPAVQLEFPSVGFTHIANRGQVEVQAHVKIQVYQVQPSAISLCFIIPAPLPLTFC